MIGKIYKELLFILLLFVLAWVGFSYLKLEPEMPNVEISIADEEKLGDLVNESVFSEMTEIHSPYLDSAIFEITKRLESNIDNTAYDYTFHVVENKQVNAFATLGGHIFIHSQLIMVTDNAEELAAVLAHEMGHVEKRHVVDRIVTEVGITVLFSVLTGGDPVLIAEIMQMSISNVFSRTQEREADDFGLKLLEKSKISPRYMAQVFRKLKEESTSIYVPEILSTHPSINARIKDALNYEVPNDFESDSLKIDWERIQNELAITK